MYIYYNQYSVRQNFKTIHGALLDMQTIVDNSLDDRIMTKRKNRWMNDMRKAK